MNDPDAPAEPAAAAADAAAADAAAADAAAADTAAADDGAGPPPLPDRLAVDPESPHHDPAVLGHDVGIRFNGEEKTNVEEYCVSEGWIRVAAGRALDRRGKPLTLKLEGVVEPYYRGAS